MINIRSSALFGRAPFFATKKVETALRIDNIVILSDSVAYGYGTEGGIANYLKETFPSSHITNLGINGLTSSGLVQKMRTDSWLIPLQQADLVLLNIGGNDLLRGFRNGGAKGLIRQFSILKRIYRQNLLEIYWHLREANQRVIIVQNNLYNSMKKEEQYFGFTNLLFRLWNTAIGEKGIIVSKTETMGKNPSIWLDSIHPNDEGYKLMHKLLIQTLSTTGFSIQSEKKSEL
ncbi:hypothetical protein BBH88_11985 [Planococcus antarcticus DSM 14505]|uniref:SGNH hydrolase-type esterase domain-containing protein n=1 Tax=Planococcus antarcticus DSM 14505 TaxID=1185653 RepID=A0ABN4RGR9_9BACL|nr:GDSL-type esterase/lipase family protein [Planococcus antarcticus]ANU10974.1 hypothetical protein BBH88_11985 [Planococcus antarcticus DSM 14505]